MSPVSTLATLGVGATLSQEESDHQVKFDAFVAMSEELAKDDYEFTFLDNAPAIDNPFGASFATMNGVHVKNGDPLIIDAAGSVCRNFSMRGGREKEAGKYMRPFIIWCALIKARRPHLVIHEITPCPSARSMLRRELGEQYDRQAALLVTRSPCLDWVFLEFDNLIDCHSGIAAIES